MTLCVVIVLLALFAAKYCNCALVSHLDECSKGTFYPRPELDNVLFTGGLLSQHVGVDTRGACVAMCVGTSDCNMVLYNPLTATCRLHAEAFPDPSQGSSQPGWQYLAVGCDGYRLHNGRPDGYVLNVDQGSLCLTNYTISYACGATSSCRTGDQWQHVSFSCANLVIHVGTTGSSLVPSKMYMEMLPFDLAAGMDVILDVAGDYIEYNEISLVQSPTDVVFMLSLRWGWLPPRAVFNTREGGLFQTEYVMDDFAIADRQNFSLRIHISESDFTTYIDGSLFMRNQQRVPLVGVNQINQRGFTAVRRLQVGYTVC